MIESFGVATPDIAKWAGITSAVFSLSQCVTGIAWGRASDRFGRKPVIMMGLLCTMVSCLLFGFSQSLPWAIIARSCAGASNGNVGIIRTMVAELTPQKELQPRAFSIMPLVWSIGSIFGPSFGGALANPAARYPNVFGHNSFLVKYPFALPNLAASILFLVGLTTGFLFLKETLDSKKHRRDYGRMLGNLLLKPFTKGKRVSKWKGDREQASSLLKHSRMSSISTLNDVRESSKASKPGKKTPRYAEVFTKQANINLLTYTLLALHAVAYDQLLPVFMHLPPQEDRAHDPDVRLPFKFAGGFGIDSSRIGIIFTVYGVVGMLLQFLVFPPLARRYGVLNCLRACTIAFPIAYIATPFAVLLPTPLSQQIGILLIMLIKCWAAIFAFPCSTILLTNSAVSLRILGTLNGVATSISAIGRAAGPALAGYTFSIGVDKGYMVLPWWTLAFCAVLGAIPTWWLVEKEGFGGGDNDNGENGFCSDEVRDDLLPDSGDDEPATSDDDSQTVGITGSSDAADQVESVDNDLVAIDDLDTFPSIKKRTTIESKDSTGQRLHPDLASIPPKRMTSPIGMRDNIGPGGGRRLSNGLGQTRSGYGVGGTAYS